MAGLLRFARLASQAGAQFEAAGAAPSLILRQAVSSLAHQPAQELLDREPLGPWQHHAWSQLQQEISAAGAYKILSKRLEEYGPQRQVHLSAVLKRVRTPEEAWLGLHAVELMRRYRARQQQHEPFNKEVVWRFLQTCAQVGAWDVIVDAFQKNHELGLGRLSLRLYACVLGELHKANELQLLVRVFETMPRNGVQPSRQIGRLLVRACRGAGQPDLAAAFQEEFEANGVPLGTLGQ